MPSTQTLTAFYVFVAGTKIKSAEANNNFRAFRGHFCPVDPTLGALAISGAYDLGNDTHYWRTTFSQWVGMYSNTAGSVPVAPTANFLNVYAKGNEVYQKTSAGIEKQVGTYTIVGSRASPFTITAAGGVAFDIAKGMRQLWFVTGDTTVGTDITANPQIAAGTLGAELMLCVPNTSTAYGVFLENGTGLDQDGYFAMTAGCNISYVHDGTEWLEKHRKEI